MIQHLAVIALLNVKQEMRGVSANTTNTIPILYIMLLQSSPGLLSTVYLVALSNNFLFGPNY